MTEVGIVGRDDSEESLQVRYQRLRLEQRLFGHEQTVRVGRYVLGEWLGAGGMGTVYAAQDPSLDRRVAIKVLHRRWSDSPHANARLVREAKAMARLQHANVLTVHEVGVEDGQPYIAMELMPGGTLADWNTSHPAAEPGRDAAAITLMRQCIDGLIAAHDAGLVHRDFKPENVLLTEHGVAKVADFGLVRAAGEASKDASQDEDPFAQLDDGRVLTRDGATPGTPRYMAPEQREGTADERSDQYALCKTFAEVLGPAGRGTKIEAVLRRGSSEDPAERFEDLRALRAACEAATGRRDRGMVVVAAVLAGGLTAGAAAWFARGDRPRASEVVTPCEDGRPLLDSAWGAERQEAIRAAFERSGSESWRHVWDGVRPRIDEYADSWVAARLDACEATRIRRVQDPQMMQMRLACLDQRKASLQLLSDAYLTADRKVVDDAPTTSTALPPIASCADRDELVYGDGALTLADPRVRAAYDAVGHAGALRGLGRFDEAAAALDAVVPELEQIGAPGLLSLARRAQAGLALSSGEYDKAARYARMALDQAELANREGETLMAWLMMSEVARAFSEYSDAEMYLERAEHLAARKPDAKGLQAEVAIGRGTFEGARGSPAEAFEAQKRALAAAEELGVAPSVTLRLRVDMVPLLSRLGREEEARELGAALLTESTETFGPLHPATLSAAGNYAQLFAVQGAWPIVAELTRPSLDLSMREYRADVVMTLRMLYAVAQQGLGRGDEARRVLEDVVAEASPILGPTHRDMITVRMQLGVFLIEAEDFEGALAAFDPLLEVVGTKVEDDADGVVHPMNRCILWSNVASARSGAGRHAPAIEAMDISMAICRAAAAPRSSWMFTSLRYGGEVYEKAGRLARAKEMYVEARGIADEIQVDPNDLKFVDEGLARLR
jgi:tetratricopeptide (TPR) repeat protein/RIO-like serine/threonine protein kinase